MSIIGVDFGTVFATVSVLGKKGEIQTIANEDGDHNIPCYVAFTSHGEIIGTQAKVQAIRNARNTISHFKNLIGLSYDEIMEQNQLPKSCKVRFEPSSSDPEAAVFIVEYFETPESEPQDLYITPKEVCTKFFAKLKETSENVVGSSVVSCVVSAPSNFTEKQKKKLEEAIRMAGFENVFLIKEPVSAVMAFDAGTPNLSEILDKIHLVADLGAHQFSVSIIQENKGLMSVLSSVDDNKVSGHAFDDVIVKFMAQEFKRKHKCDIFDNSKSVSKLAIAAEQTKRILSMKDMAPCFVESLYEGMDLNMNMNRGRFEGLAESLFQRCEKVVRQALEEAQLSAEDIDFVYLIGGSSRMARFQSMMKSMFPPKSEEGPDRILSNIDAAEAISRGCAVLGKQISEIGLEDYAEALKKGTQYTTDVSKLSRSIGIMDANGQYTVVLPRGAPIPVRRVIQATSAVDSQNNVLLPIYEEGETHLGDLFFADLPEDMKSGDLKIEVTFTIESDLRLQIEAKEKSTAVSTKLVI